MGELIDLVRELASLVVDACWWLLAFVFDRYGDLSIGWGGVLTALLLTASFLSARLLQSRLVGRLKRYPDRRVSLVRLDLKLSLPGLLLAPIYLPVRLVHNLYRWVRRLLHSRKQRKDGAEEEPKPDRSAPFLAATLGPTYLFAGVIVGLLYLLARLAEPLLRTRLELSPDSAPWQYLFLGHRPELAPHLPLSGSPYLAALLCLLLWLTIWSWTGRLLRFAWSSQLGRNLVEKRDSQVTLGPWRRWADVPQLVGVAPSYRRWAVPLVAAGFPLLLVAWTSVGDRIYRLRGSEVAVVAILWLSWALHLVLRGEELLAEPEEEGDGAPAPVEAAGWEALLDHLEKRRQVTEPLPCAPPRLLSVLPASRADPHRDPLLSPLLWQIHNSDLPLSVMQHEEMARLSRLGHVFTDEPAGGGELQLPAAAANESDAERHRNRIVLAPEGAGKSTLAILAACNHSLVHTRASLIIVHTRGQAKRLFGEIKRRVRPSTLRWNLRLALADKELDSDLSQSILPDLVVCDLESLVVNLLDRSHLYAPFLANLGLVVIDDADSFHGAAEAHAQLAFRRLRLTVAQQLEVSELGPESEPMFLLLACDAMRRTEAWLKALCGIDADVKRYSMASEAELQRQAAALRGKGREVVDEEQVPENPAEQRQRIENGRHQRFYRLSDFRLPDDRQLGVAELIADCEEKAVPWSYRSAAGGDDPAGGEGIFAAGSLASGLVGGEQPEHRVEPEEACVVLIDGPWSGVRRQLARLQRAGCRFSRFRNPDGSALLPRGDGDSEERPEAIAFITLCDPDEEMAFTQRDPSFDLATRLAALPHPVLRPPTPRAADSHLASDLTQHWFEVEQLVKVYGNRVADPLRELCNEELLLIEERTEVHQLAYEYRRDVYVRALASAVPEIADQADDLLPPKVSQVHLTAPRAVRLIDRLDMDRLARLDADSAFYRFYPGRVFTHREGSYTVVGRVGSEMAEESGGTLEAGDILVEPTLGDDRSSPRRSFRFTWLEDRNQLPQELSDSPILDPETVQIGECPLRVGLLPTEVEGVHLATFRLDPLTGEVRQRRFAEAGDQRTEGYPRLATETVLLQPNPRFDPPPGGEPAPLLTLGQARLVAAALRLILPSVYRGAGEAAEVTIDLAATSAGATRRADPGDGEVPEAEPLGEEAGLVLFDLGAGGAGIARAVHRDGIELLLRLVRLVLERVLDPRRLLAIYDQWPGEMTAQDRSTVEGVTAYRPAWEGAASAYRGELSRAQNGRGAGEMADGLPAALRETAEELELGTGLPGVSSDHEPAESADLALELTALRAGTLLWLDRHLRPEGGPGMAAGEADRRGQVEPGEGDLFDRGRVWYSRGGSVQDLLWVKHRWRASDGGDLSLDIGFDRHTAEGSRLFTEDAETVALYRAFHREYLAAETLQLPDGRTWGAPRSAWSVSGEDEDPVATGGDPAADETVGSFHSLASAVAAANWPALDPLGARLSELAGVDASEPSGRLRLTSFLARFVQGIPYSVPMALRRGLRPPVSTLLYRRGDCDSKSLLLALLLKRCGIEAGLFVSFDEGHAMAAAAVPPPVDLASSTQAVYRDDEGKFARQEDGSGEPERYARSKRSARAMKEQLKAWAETVGLPIVPELWADLPERPDAEAAVDLFVPIESTSYLPVGVVSIADPKSWCFLPLTAVWHRLHLEEHLSATDAAETEEFE